MSVTYIGTEYIIAHLLIAFSKVNKYFVTTKDLFAFEHCLWEKSKLSSGINIVPLFSAIRLTNALWDYSDYFSYNKQKEISIAKGKSAEDLEARFCGFLPLEALVLLDKTAKEFVKTQVSVEKAI